MPRFSSELTNVPASSNLNQRGKSFGPQLYKNSDTLMVISIWPTHRLTPSPLQSG